jgi:hypothetical protein
VIRIIFAVETRAPTQVRALLDNDVMDILLSYWHERERRPDELERASKRIITENMRPRL